MSLHYCLIAGNKGGGTFKILKEESVWSVCSPCLRRLHPIPLKPYLNHKDLLCLPLVSRWWRIRLKYRSYRRHRFIPWVGKIPWRRTRQRAPVFLPGESRGTEEPGGLRSIGWQSRAEDWVAKHSTVRATEVTNHDVEWAHREEQE